MINKVKEIRENANMTQEELSALSGVHRVLISQIENKKTKGLRSATMEKIAHGLNKPVGDVFFLD